MTHTYLLADRIVQITSLYSEVHTLCDKYRIETGSNNFQKDTEPDISVSVTHRDIEFERLRSAREEEHEGLPVHVYTDAYLETLAVYRQIAEEMPRFDTVLVHGSCVAVDGAGYLFTAKSGTGKSTHTRLWREMFKDRAIMINDDKPLIRITKEGAWIYGTPWDGKHRLSTNTSVPLKAVCILERAEKNTIRPVTVSEAYPMFLQQVYRPADARSLNMTMNLIDRLFSGVNFYRLGCNMESDAAKTAYEAMRQE